ncbi:MAG: hypothetical protein M3Y09_13715, partial [Actinomycetota bacterium]|nr:hypothetical protein [Actinomycetota bacterium]
FPVIALLHAPDPAFVKEASKRGMFARINDNEIDDWQSAIHIVLRRFTEYHDLERSLRTPRDHRASQRHPHATPRLTEAAAFEMLRAHSRTDHRKVIDLATTIVDGHRLLPKQTTPPDQQDSP